MIYEANEKAQNEEGHVRQTRIGKRKRNRRGMQRKFRAKSAQEETPYPFTACTHPAHHILLFLLKEKESQVLFLLFLSKMFDQQEASAILTTENYACCASRNGYVHRKKKRKRGKKALVLLPFFFFSLSLSSVFTLSGSCFLWI